jgi:hypothetical protein
LGDEMGREKCLGKEEVLWRDEGKEVDFLGTSLREVGR